MRALIAIALLASVSLAAPGPPALWEPLASRPGLADLHPLTDDARSTAPYAVRATLAPGIGPSGVAATGGWAAPILFRTRAEIEVRLALRADGPVELTFHGLGGPEPVTAPVIPLGDAVQRLRLPCGPAMTGHFAVLADAPCALELLQVTPVTVAALGPDQWTEALSLCDEVRDIESNLSLLARQGILPVGLDDVCLRRRAGLFARPGAATLDALRAAARDAHCRAGLGHRQVALSDRCSLLERRENTLKRLGALGRGPRSSLRDARGLLRDARRANALSDPRACADLLDRTDDELQARSRELREASTGALCAPIVRNGRFEWRTGEPFVPVPRSIPLAEAGDGVGRVLDEGANMALIEVPPTDLRSPAWVAEARLRILAEDCDALALPFALRLPATGPRAKDVARRLVSLAGRSPSYFACVIEGDTTDSDLADALAEAAPGAAVGLRPPTPCALAASADVLAGLRSEGSTPAALGLCTSDLAARFATTPIATGATTSGNRLMDHRAVGPLSPAERRALAWGGRPRPHRVAVVASAAEVGRSTSRAPMLLSVLQDLNVDADLILDSEVARDPDLPTRYKALVYEAASLDADAFGSVWRSGVPTLYLGPLGGVARGESGAQETLVDAGAFLRRTGGLWRLDTPSPSVGLGMPASLLDPLERALDDGWFRLAVAPPPPPAIWACLDAETGDSLRWRVFRLWVNQAQADSGAVLHLPAGLPPGAEILVNGERLREPRPATPSPAEGFPPGIAGIRPGLLAWDKENRNAIGLRAGPEPDWRALSLEFAPLLTGRATEPYGHLGPGEVAFVRVPVGAPLLRRDALVPSARVILEAVPSGAPLLLRQGNSVLWNASAPPDGPLMERLIASFLRAVAEDHVYPPNGATRGLLVEDTSAGILIARRWRERTEVVLGGQNALVSRCGPEPEWQRIGGANVVALPPAPVGTLYALWRSELQVRPEGGETTLRGLRRDASLPGRLLLEVRTSGAGGRMALSPAFIGRVRCFALVDGAAARVRREGGSYTFAFSPGDHTVRVEAYGAAPEPQ